MIGFLKAVFQLDTKDAEKSAKSLTGVLNKELKGSLQGMTGNAGIAGKALSAMGPAGMVAAAGIGAASAAAAFSVGALVDMGSALTDLSRTSDISVDALQKMEAFGAPLGLSLESMADAANKLTKALGTGGEGVTQALNTLGLSMSQLAGMTADQRLLAVQVALSKMTDPLAKAAAGSALLGKSWDAMKLSAKDIEEGNKALERTLTLSNEAAAAGDDLGDTWDLFLKNTKTLMAEGVVPLAEALTKVLDTLIKLQKDWTILVDWKQSNIPPWLSGLASAAFIPGGAAGLVGNVGSFNSFANTDAALARISQQKQEIAKLSEGFTTEWIARVEYAIDFEKKVDAKARAERLARLTEGFAKEEALQEKYAANRIQAEAELRDSLIRDLNRGYEKARQELYDSQLAATAGYDPNIPNAGGTRFPGMTGNAPGMFPAVVKSVAESATHLGLSLEAAAQISQAFSGAFQGSTKTIFNALVQGSAAAGVYNKDLKGFEGALNKATVAALGFAAILNATKAGSTGARTAGGALAGASAGAAFGPWGMAVGAIVGALTGFFRGSSMDKFQKEAEETLGVSISRAFAEAAKKSGKDLATFLAEAWGEAFDEGTASVYNFAQEVLKLSSNLNLTDAELKTELNQSIPMLIEHFGEFRGVGLEALDAIIAAARVAGAVTQDLLHLERLRAGIIEKTVEDLADLGLTPEEVAKLAEATGKGIQTNVEREATDLGLSPETLAALAAAAGLEDPTKLSELLDALGMSVTELAAALGVTIPEEEKAAIAEAEKQRQSQIDVLRQIEVNTRGWRGDSGSGIPGDNVPPHAAMGGIFFRRDDSPRPGPGAPGGGSTPAGQVVVAPGSVSVGEGGAEVVTPVKALFGSLGQSIANQVAESVGGQQQKTVVIDRGTPSADAKNEKFQGQMLAALDGLPARFARATADAIARSTV